MWEEKKVSWSKLIVQKKIPCTINLILSGFECKNLHCNIEKWLYDLQVELATGEFPYKNCRTDFEVLTKVLTEDPPLLPPGREFSHEFCSFVRDW